MCQFVREAIREIKRHYELIKFILVILGFLWIAIFSFLFILLIYEPFKYDFGENFSPQLATYLILSVLVICIIFLVVINLKEAEIIKVSYWFIITIFLMVLFFKYWFVVYAFPQVFPTLLRIF
jgi:CDP-diglyceride synthetase